MFRILIGAFLVFALLKCLILGIYNYLTEPTLTDYLKAYKKNPDSPETLQLRRQVKFDKQPFGINWDKLGEK